MSKDRQKGYPLSDRKGVKLQSPLTQVGSGFIESTMPMNDMFVCVGCNKEWRTHSEKGVYECPKWKCKKKWRVRSAESAESGKCPRCDCVTRTDKQGKLRYMGETRTPSKSSLWRETKWCARCKYEWRVVRDGLGGMCPWCETTWWKSGEEDVCKCASCGKMVKKGCVCQSCISRGKKEERWSKLTILSARSVIFDKHEWKDSVIIFFDEGESQPIKLQVGKGGSVSLSEINNDTCVLYAYTCNSELVRKLEKMICDKQVLGERMLELKRNAGKDEGSEGDVPCAVIGYPHGHHCYVTLGVSDTAAGNGKEVIEYEVNTCPGNAGSIVCRFGAKDKSIHIHKGAFIKDQGNTRVGRSNYNVSPL